MTSSHMSSNFVISLRCFLQVPRGFKYVLACDWLLDLKPLSTPLSMDAELLDGKA